MAWCCRRPPFVDGGSPKETSKQEEEKTFEGDRPTKKFYQRQIEIRNAQLYKESPDFVEKPKLLEKLAQQFQILAINQYPKFYRLAVKSIKKTSRSKQVLLCKYRGCEKHFAKIFCLENHMMTHDKLRPYACNLCGKKFRRCRDFQWHRAKFHGRFLPD